MNDAFLHRRRRVSRNDQAEVLNVAMSLAGRRSDVLRPFPPWLVGGTANTHAADADDFKPTLVKGANFIGFLKPFENNCRVDHWLWPLRVFLFERSCMNRDSSPLGRFASKSENRAHN